MQYCENWEKIKLKYEQFWAMENHDRPILSITAPRTQRSPMKPFTHASLKERWNDTEYMLEHARHTFENTYYAGEAFPSLNPNLGPDFFAACYGAQLEYGETTSWAHPIMSDAQADEYREMELQTQAYYYQKMLEMTKAAVEDGRDRYIVGVTDIHPGADGLVSLRGPENLCLDTIDRPEFIQKSTMDLLRGFKTMYTDLYQLSSKYQNGASNWMGIWYPGRWYVTSCDFCCMISKGMFEDLILPELEAELDFLDASIFHLDGPGALKHLDALLQLKKLKGIQWVYGAGQPGAAHWLEVLQKIQAAGKCIQVNVSPADLPVLLENLRPEGVMYCIHASSEEEADALVRLADTFHRS